MARVRTIHKFVELYIELCTKLRTSGSPLGSQLEILRNSCGKGEPCVFVRRDDGDRSRGALNALDRITFFGVVVRVWSVLTSEEQRILLLKHTPARKLDPSEGWKVEQFVIHREVRISELIEGDGLAVVSLLRDDNTGELTGWANVEETIARPWSDDEIAEFLDVSVPHIRRCVVAAGRKIRNHDLFPQLAEGI